jgi:hypothetical protein
MRYQRLSAALAVSAAVLFAVPAAARADGGGGDGGAAGPCAVGRLSSMLPVWSVSCASTQPVNVDTVYDAQTYSPTPITIHENEPIERTVAGGSTWTTSLAVPGYLYLEDSCSTVSVAGTATARACFTRGALPTGGEPPACHVAGMSGLPVAWSGGCGMVGGTVIALGDYEYVRADGRPGFQPIVQVVHLNPGQSWAVTVPAPAGATVTHTHIRLFAVDANGTAADLGTAHFDLLTAGR